MDFETPQAYYIPDNNSKENQISVIISLKFQRRLEGICTFVRIVLMITVIATEIRRGSENKRSERYGSE